MVARPAAVAASAPAVERMRRLAQGALVVMTGFLLSRLLGAVRNIVIAAHFGAGPQYGAYVAAIALPDVVFQVLVGGAVGSAFIPVFKRYHTLGRDDEAWHLTSSVINMFALVALVTSAVLAVFARPIMDVWVAGQDAEFRDLVANLTRILLISPAVFAVSTFCSSVLNSYNRFAIAAMAPLLYNLAIIAAALLLSGPLGIYGLALGAVVGAVLHLLIQLPFCLRLGMRWRPVVDVAHAGVREVVRLFAPRVLGLGVVQLNQVLSAIVLASFLGAASIGYLNYAWQLIMLPLALAMAVGTAVFPTLSEENALENRAGFQQVFLLSLRMILFLTIPASIGLIVLGVPLIRLVFERGQFDSATTAATASAMVFYALGLAGHATVEIVDRVFYARHDTRTPVLAAVLAVGINVVASLVLMRIDFRGLALANSIAALVEAGVLLRFVSRRMPGLTIGRLTTPALRILAASLVMGLPVAWLAAQLDPLLRPYGTPGEALLLVTCVSFGAVLYGLTSIAFRSEEISALRRLVRR
ncbi:MAG TPA: murein biosynthesis integral membrane protein MurJ [Chloroflexota bacterium]|nr:murein biosynthesis integral membrane protein MurJ [Chloroflexota bacterium]